MTDKQYFFDLREALLLSKQEDCVPTKSNTTCKQVEKDNSLTPKQKFKKTPKSIPLQQFLQGEVSNDICQKNKSTDFSLNFVTDKPDMFKEVEREAARILRFDSALNSSKEESLHLRFQQYEAELETKNNELANLNEQVAQLREELKNVTLKNKKMCAILTNGESMYILVYLHLINF